MALDTKSRQWANTAGRAGAFAMLRMGDAGLTDGVTGDRDIRTSPCASLSLFYRY